MTIIKQLKLFSAILLLGLSVQPAFSHPGRTASDGCHYCRTNCDKWGVPQGERHCHNGVKQDINAHDSFSYSIKPHSHGHNENKILHSGDKS